MNNTTGRTSALAAAVFVALGLFAFADQAGAQTKKKTTKKPTTSSTTTPQPVQSSTMPEIISQADQEPPINTGNLVQVTDNQVAPQTETFEEKIDRLSNRMKEMNTRMKSLESSKQNAYDERQKRLLLNLDILTRAEQRAESLRKQLFELIEKENSMKTKLETIDYDSRPEVIERQVAFAGSLRPEELREARRKNLEAEKRNLATLLLDIQATRTSLEANVQKADQLVEKLRAVLEKDIDEALAEKPEEAVKKEDTKDQ